MAEAELPINFEVNALLTAEELLDDESLRALCQRSQVPTLFMHGADDPRPPGGAAQLAEWIPTSTFHAVADAGHLPWVEQPALVRARLKELLHRATGSA